MQIGIANGVPLNEVVTGDDLIPVYDQSTGTEGYVNLATATQKAFSSTGTANGVLYINGSKEVTSGSGLTFDGANLGIGTSSPGAKLEINSGANAGALRITDENNNNSSSTVRYTAASYWARKDNIPRTGSDPLASNGSTAAIVFTDEPGNAGFPTAVRSSGIELWTADNTGLNITPTMRLRIDSSGNLGLGVTPSAWFSQERVFQFGITGALYSNTNFGFTTLANNLYRNASGSEIYIYSVPAVKYVQHQTGEHRWFTAPSGTAGDAISFTQAMTLDASGNLLVGTTSANANLAKGVQIASTNWGMYASTSAVTGAGCSIIAERANDGNVGQFYRNAVLVGSISVTASATAYNTSSDYRLKDNQAPLTDSGAFIDALKPKTWNWKADGTKGVGFIAHEVQEVSPTSVVGEKDATRIEQYEVSPAVPATHDEEGNELTPAVEAVMGEREVPAYQAMEYGSAEFIANIVAELQSLRKRVAALEAR